MNRVTTADTEDLTVVFTDLVRFTSLTEVHGDVAGADAAAALTEVVKANSADGVHLVKTLGDGVLLTSRSPDGALKSAASTVERLHDLDRGIDARVGADQGPVLARDGDLGGLYLLLVLPFIDIGLAQNAMFDAAPPDWGRFLPAHGAVRVMMDGAFTASFDETAALILAIGWLVALWAAAVVVFRRVTVS